MKIGAIVQARLSSKRLPGKVLKPVAGKTLLLYIIERLEHCKGIESIVVATSSEKSDNPVNLFCQDYNIPCVRGSLEDVAGRFFDAIQQYPWDAFVRINGDSPLIDQTLIDKGIDLFHRNNVDIVTNVFPRSYPPGQSVEIIRSDAFRQTYPLMNKQEYFEHVTPYFYQNSTRFTIFNFRSDVDYGNLHLSVDTPEDFLLFSEIISTMTRPHWEYLLPEIHEIVNDIIRKRSEES